MDPLLSSQALLNSGKLSREEPASGWYRHVSAIGIIIP